MSDRRDRTSDSTQDRLDQIEHAEDVIAEVREHLEELDVNARDRRSKDGEK